MRYLRNSVIGNEVRNPNNITVIKDYRTIVKKNK